jgi:xanthine phosphoribosyltransferase
VLIIDDFLASGQTIMGLVRLASAAGASIVGIGILIEKRFEGGRDLLDHLEVPIEALAVITDMSDGKIVFEGE